MRAVVSLAVVTLVVKLLVVRHFVAALLFLFHLQAGRRALEVIARRHHEASFHLSRKVPAADVVGIGRRLGSALEVRQAFVASYPVVHALRIHQHELVCAVGVLKVPVDALVLKQASDKVVVALAVLHAVGPLAVSAKQLELEIGNAMVLKHFLDDVGNRQFLKNSAV